MLARPGVRGGWLAAALALALILPALPSGPAAAKGVYFPETFTLANGLEVVVVTNRRVPVVSHMLWYKVGGYDCPATKSGLAHFLEHLMFKGTATVGPGDFSKIVARNGGRDNAFTSHDYTAYFQNVARDRLELVMTLEADRMVNLHLTDALVYPERDVVMEERRQRTDDVPGDRLSEQLEATVFVNHPYGTPVIGWEHEIKTLTREDAEGFYRTWYAPNNAILVVSGDIDAAELRPLAEKTYGRVPARAVPERQAFEVPALTAERRVILHDPEIREPSVVREVLAPSYRHGAPGQAYALEVLAEIMSSGVTGRLYRSLVVEQRVAVGAGLGYSPLVRGSATLEVSATPVPGGDIDRTEAALTAEVAKLLKDGVTEEEVATARKRMLAANAYARDSLQGPAYALGMALVTGHSLDDVESWPDRIAAVTAAEVNEAARAVLGAPGGVTGRLLPAEATSSKSGN
ncbi:MAG: pitrilysin family protein [Rhodospirillaceae bacterium]